MAKPWERSTTTLTSAQMAEMRKLYTTTTLTAKEIAEMFPAMNRNKVLGHAHRRGWKKYKPPIRNAMQVDARGVPLDDADDKEYCRCTDVCDWCAGVNTAEPADWRMKWLSTRRLADMKPLPYEPQDETQHHRPSLRVRKLLST